MLGGEAAAVTTRAELRERGDLSPDEADDVFELAARLQIADRAFDPARRPMGEGRALPEHLEVAEHFIADARTRLVQRHLRAAQRSLRPDTPSRLPRLLVAVLLLGFVATLSALGAGRSRVTTAARRAADQEQALHAELVQQIDRASTVATIAGPRRAALDALRQAAEDAPDIPEKLVATETLGREMRQALLDVPPASRPERAALLAELDQQVRESQQRISTSARRWREANGAWTATTERGLGRLATLTGIASAPPGPGDTLPRP